MQSRQAHPRCWRCTAQAIRISSGLCIVFTSICVYIRTHHTKDGTSPIHMYIIVSVCVGEYVRVLCVCLNMYLYIHTSICIHMCIYIKEYI